MLIHGVGAGSLLAQGQMISHWALVRNQEAALANQSFGAA